MLLGGVFTFTKPATTEALSKNFVWGPNPMDLGAETDFTEFPTVIDLEKASYFLVKSDKGYKLLSTNCPHQGGEVVDWGSCFMCPDHGWRFEYTEGTCVNGPDAEMYSSPVVVEHGRLIVQELPGW